MTYGNKRDYPKIDIFSRSDNGAAVYIGSTTWAKTCRQAVEKYRDACAFIGRQTPPSLFARFNKGR